MRNRRQTGFTLVEIALVMVIVSAVLAGGIAGFQSFRDSARYSETDSYLTEARTALLGFVLMNGYMPCPDEDEDGRQDTENHSSGKTCTAVTGALPWQDLGLEPRSPWDVDAFYAVNQEADSEACDTSAKDEPVCFFEDEEAPLSDLTTPPVSGTAGSGTLEVTSSSGDVIATDLLAVVGVLGKNAVQTIADCAAASANESENCDADDQFVMDRVRTNPDNFFDDKLVWIHANTVKGKLKDAGFL